MHFIFPIDQYNATKTKLGRRTNNFNTMRRYRARRVVTQEERVLSNNRRRISRSQVTTEKLAVKLQNNRA